METVADIIRQWGSAEQFADDLGLKWRSHARVMKLRGSIPRRYWPIIVETSAARGTPISIDDLEAVHSKREAAQ